MDKRLAARLQKDDKVTVKEGNHVGTVLGVNVVKNSKTRTIDYVEILLENGYWYNHQEIS